MPDEDGDVIENVEIDVTQEQKEIIKENKEEIKDLIKDLGKIDVDYINFDEFINALQKEQIGINQTINSTLESCMSYAQSNDRREKNRDINTETYMGDPWKALYSDEKRIRFFLIEVVVPHLQSVHMSDQIALEKASKVISSYRNVADAKQKLEFNERMLLQVREYSESQISNSLKRHTESLERETKLFKDNLEIIQNQHKSQVASIDASYKAALEELKRSNKENSEYYLRMRQSDMAVFKEIANALVGKGGKHQSYDFVDTSEEEEPKKKKYSAKVDENVSIESPVEISHVNERPVVIKQPEPQAQPQQPAVAPVTMTQEDEIKMYLKSIIAKNKNVQPVDAVLILKKSMPGKEIKLSTVSAMMSNLKAEIPNK